MKRHLGWTLLTKRYSNLDLWQILGVASLEFYLFIIINLKKIIAPLSKTFKLIMKG